MSLGKDQDTTDATRPHSDVQTARIAELEREVRRLRGAIKALVEEDVRLPLHIPRDWDVLQG
jgi:hypothetical protein